MTKLKYLSEYLIIRSFYLLLRISPELLLRLASSTLAFLLNHLLSYRKYVVRKNLEIAFPEKSAKERKSILNGFYKHLACFIFEYIRGPYYTKEFFQKHVHIENPELIEKYAQEPIILVSGHFGEFNLNLQALMELIGDQINVILKKQRNPFVNRFTTEQRELCRQKPIYSDGAFRQCIRVLKNKEKVAFLNDQHAGKNGIDIPFFGKDAPSMSGLAALKDKFDYPLISTYCARLENGQYRIWLKEIKLERGLEKSAYYEAILKAYHQGLEEAIRNYPEQYLWTHRRWDLKNYKSED